jgi:hypothetical protein
MCAAIKTAIGNKSNLKLLISFMIRDEMKVKSAFGSKIGGF